MGEILLDPPQAMFPDSKVGGQSKHQIVNQTAVRLAFKCKCSDNNLYRLQPVFGLLNPGQSFALTITRLPGPAKNDRMLIQYLQAPSDNIDVQNVFKAAQCQNIPEMRFPLQAMWSHFDYSITRLCIYSFID